MSGFAPVLPTNSFRADPVPQNWEALGAWLHGHGMALGTEPPRQFAGGLANLNYLISVDGRQAVLRRPPGGQLAEGASDMAREWRVLSRLPRHYGRAPRALAYCADPSVLGGQFQIIEYRSGTAMSDEVPAVLAGASGGRLAGQFIEALAELHAIDVDGNPELRELGRPDRFIARQIAGWKRRTHNAFDANPPSSAGRVLTWLESHQPPQVAPAVLHSDYKFDNVLFDHTGAATSVIDWDMSTLGDPLFDLGITLSYWALPGDDEALRGLRMAPSLQPGFPDRNTLVDMYFAAAGRDPVPLGFYLALGRLRLAIAWQQMYVLFRRGDLVGDRYAAFGQVAQSVLAATADSLSTDQI